MCRLLYLLLSAFSLVVVCRRFLFLSRSPAAQLGLVYLSTLFLEILNSFAINKRLSPFKRSNLMLSICDFVSLKRRSSLRFNLSLTPYLLFKFSPILFC